MRTLNRGPSVCAVDFLSQVNRGRRLRRTACPKKSPVAHPSSSIFHRIDLHADFVVTSAAEGRAHMVAVQPGNVGPGLGWQLVKGGDDGTFLNLGAALNRPALQGRHGPTGQGCVW